MQNQPCQIEDVMQQIFYFCDFQKWIPAYIHRSNPTEDKKEASCVEQ